MPRHETSVPVSHTARPFSLKILRCHTDSTEQLDLVWRDPLLVGLRFPLFRNTVFLHLQGSISLHSYWHCDPSKHLESETSLTQLRIPCGSSPFERCHQLVIFKKINPVYCEITRTPYICFVTTCRGPLNYRRCYTLLPIGFEELIITSLLCSPDTASKRSSRLLFIT